MHSWAGGEIEWQRKYVDFLECYSPLPEDQAGEKEGERTEGYGHPPPLITSYTHESNKMHQSSRLLSRPDLHANSPFKLQN